MHLFQITIDEAEEAKIVQERLEAFCPDHFYTMGNGVSWICAINNRKVTMDLAEEILNSNRDKDKGPRVSGIVVRMSTYTGYYEMSLWEKMEAWSD